MDSNSPDNDAVIGANCMRAREYLESQERGIVMVLFSMFLFVLCSFLAFSVDLGRSYNERHKMQVAADSASLAGLNALVAGTDYNHVLQTILSNGEYNQISSSEITETSPRCGVWTQDTFIPHSDGECDNTSTAVEVTIRRSLPTGLGFIFGLAPSAIETRAVAYKPLYRPGTCIRPFGIENSYFSQLELATGSTFTVDGSQSAGNWGKLDINTNASSGTAFTDAMLNNICDDSIVPGSYVSTGTGNAQISQVFQTLLADTTLPLASQSMVFAITSDFPNGNGQVQLLRFIRVDLLSQRGSGQNWQATLRAIDLNAEPEHTIPPDRELMR